MRFAVIVAIAKPFRAVAGGIQQGARGHDLSRLLRHSHPCRQPGTGGNHEPYCESFRFQLHEQEPPGNCALIVNTLLARYSSQTAICSSYSETRNTSISVSAMTMAKP